MRKNRPKPTHNRTLNRSNRRLRIIGGVWRGRRITFSATPGLRPTPDRVRETLFNWLQPIIPGAVCLDLFAGSGALGFEAASRGAGSVMMVDRNPWVIDQLHWEAKQLKANQVEIIQADALNWLQTTSRLFDIVFLDPPFAQDLLGDVINKLAYYHPFKPNARVYIETARDDTVPFLPLDWAMARAQQAGQVKYYLAVVNVNTCGK